MSRFAYFGLFILLASYVAAYPAATDISSGVHIIEREVMIHIIPA